MAGVLTGGLRDRMLQESLIQAIVGELTSLGWFASGRQHSPIVHVDEFPDESGNPAPNTLAITTGTGVGVDMELGSKLEEHTTTLFVDFFAESDALGMHVIGDVYAYLKTTRGFPIYDYRQATPPVDFYAQLEEGVDKRRPTRVTAPWQRHWFTVSFTVADERANA